MHLRRYIHHLLKQMLRHSVKTVLCRSGLPLLATRLTTNTPSFNKIIFSQVRNFGLSAPKYDRRTRSQVHTMFDDMRMPDMTLVENMQFIACHGTTEEERSTPQRFIVSVQVESDAERAVYFDETDSAVSTLEVFRVTREVVTNGKTYHTLEHMAHDIISAVLTRYPEAGAASAEVSCPDLHRFLPHVVSHDAMLARAGEALCTLQSAQDKANSLSGNGTPSVNSETDSACAANVVDLTSSLGLSSIKQAGVRIRRQRTQLLLTPSCTDAVREPKSTPKVLKTKTLGEKRRHKGPRGPK